MLCSGVPVNDQVTCCTTAIAYNSYAAMFWQINEGRQGRPFNLDTLWPTEDDGKSFSWFGCLCTMHLALSPKV